MVLPYINPFQIRNLVQHNIKHIEMNRYILKLVTVSAFMLSLLSTDLLHGQCTLDNLSIEAQACTGNDVFSVVIAFDVTNGSDTGFTVLGNGANYGQFSYEELPITINALPGNCVTSYEFIVRDLADPTCAIFDELGVICCGQDCDISLADAEVGDCSDDGNFSLSLAFTAMNISSNDSLTVTVNGDVQAIVSGSQTEITLDNQTSVTSGSNTIEICSQQIPDCCTTGTFVNPCQCNINNITAQVVDCDSDSMTYFAVINFDHVATNDSFQMGYSDEGDNNFLGVFAYADLPIIAGPINMSDNEREMLIVDKEDFFCFNSAFLGVVNDCDIACQISNVFAESYNCDDGAYFMDVEFDTEDIEGSTFSILVDGVDYATFTYGQTFYTVGPIIQNCFAPPIVVIQDSEIQSCSDFFNFDEPICCSTDCFFAELVADIECSDDGEVTLYVDYMNTSVPPGTSFFLSFNGLQFGPYSPTSGTAILELEALAEGEYTITISADTAEECSETAFFTVDCTSDCEISFIEEFDFICDGDVAFAVIGVESVGVSDSFTIIGNGQSYGTFAYDGSSFYSVGPLDPDCETIYEFVISDLSDPDCQGTIALSSPICCTICNIRDLTISDVECDGDEIRVIVVDFLFDETASDSFAMRIDLTLVDIFAYSDLPLALSGIFDPSFTIDIEDVSDPACSGTFDVEVACPSGCVIDEGQLTVSSCDDDFYALSLDFVFENVSDSFQVQFLNTTQVFAYADLPVVIVGIPLGIDMDFIISDLEDSGCSIVRSFLLEICETSTSDPSLDLVHVYHYGNILTIENPTEADYVIQIISLDGKMLLTQTSGKSSTSSITTDSWIAGIYVVHIKGENGLRAKKIAVIR